MSEHEHADLEALSAFVDGEAPEWAGHVASCATCRASVEQLRAVSAAVAAPIEPPDPRLRDLAIGAALDDVARRHTTERARARRRRFHWQYELAAVAAILLLVLGFSALLMQQRSSDDATTVAGAALQETAPRSDTSLGASGGAGATADAAALADLGDVRDAATLLARARQAVSSGAAAAPPPPTAFSSRSAAPGAPTAVGTRPCEEQARTREPALREVVYFAIARQGSVPAYVLGFSTGPAPSPVTLLLLAQNGCGELLRAVGP